MSLVGAAGSGKSRVIYEFKQRLLEEGEGAYFFEGRCAALNQSIPLAPFVAMLRQYFDLSAADDEDSACRKVEARLGKAMAKVGDAYPLLCRVLSVPTALPADLPLERLKRETFEAIAKLVATESHRAPVVMILEDLHWIDEPSQELLEMVVTRLSRAQVLVLVSHRPEYRPQWRTEAAVTQVHLRPLLEADVLRISRALGGGALPDELEARILAKAEGSPFFAEEITRSLIEEGFLAMDNGSVRRPVRWTRSSFRDGARGHRGAPDRLPPPPSGSPRWRRCWAGSFSARNSSSSSPTSRSTSSTSSPSCGAVASSIARACSPTTSIASARA